ncbi:MAG: DUF2442 domain-containing protein [Bacteroidia bacterium]|nr:DUF2442 domain-containing protein [Bacteroidia bacterium]
MLYLITKIIEVKPYKIICQFNNNEIRQIDLEKKIKYFVKINPELFNVLLDFNYFKTVKLDSYGTICWNNNIDFCPDILYQMSTPIDVKF